MSVREPVNTITWDYYYATKEDLCDRLGISVPAGGEIDIHLADNGIEIVIKGDLTAAQKALRETTRNAT